jgi:hypothetical protein
VKELSTAWEMKIAIVPNNHEPLMTQRNAEKNSIEIFFSLRSSAPSAVPISLEYPKSIYQPITP